jgi:hypothetical protein
MAIIKSERFAGKPHLVGEFPIVFDESGLAEVPAAVACLVSGMKFFVVLDATETPTTESIQSAAPVIAEVEPVELVVPEDLGPPELAKIYEEAEPVEEVKVPEITEKPESKKSKRR